MAVKEIISVGKNCFYLKVVGYGNIFESSLKLKMLLPHHP